MLERINVSMHDRSALLLRNFLKDPGDSDGGNSGARSIGAPSSLEINSGRAAVGDQNKSL